MIAMIRKLVLGAMVSILTAVGHAGDKVDVWVLLSEPPTASGITTPEKVRQQQQAVMAQLKELGAVELARVGTTRNAIAVSIDRSKLPEVKQLSGARSVSPVRDIQRDPPAPIR